MSPDVAPRVARTAQPRALVGSQTTRSGSSAMTTGSTSVPRRVATAMEPPSTTPTSAAVATLSRARAGLAVPARCSSPSCIRPASISSCQVASNASPLAGTSGATAATLGATGRFVPGARRTSSSRAAATLGRPSGTSSSSASACSTRPSDMAPVLAIVRSNGRRRPSHVTYRPAFSAGGATGSTTSACAVTALARISRLTMKPARPRASVANVGSARSAGSTPPMTSAASEPSTAARRIASVSRPVSVGTAAPHACSTSARAASSPTARPPGSSVGSAPASMAPRSPARRGTQASLAPVRVARSAAALSAPGEDASRSPTRMTAPSLDSASVTAPSRPPSAAASAPGSVATSVPSSLARPREANGATDQTAVRPRRVDLRIRRNTIGDSSSGSKPTSSTAGACSSEA